MTREREIFLEALERASMEARSAFVARATAGDSKLKEAVEALLANHQPDTFLEQGAGGVLRKSLGVAVPTIKLEFPSDSSASDKPGDCIGRYRLLEKLGEGGFGTVYVAEQREPVKRRVALKIIKLGMDTREVVARFEAERQALAMMDHPNISKVLDAGALENGRPYFVMELVRGIKITEYCDQNQLPIRQRLDLLIQICQAVQHAHLKGIIHRDLKPSNILVTLHDGIPVPKVIDFGIAKATQGELTSKTVYTQFQQFVGTPAYMSPEQAEMSGLDIDTRSDIYSLGVLLYELLSGKTPFEQKELLSAGLDAMRRIIREKEPPRPSTRLSTMMQAELTETAQRRQSDATQLVHSVRGDLDWIVMKCLEKDRRRRYETARELADDLQRYVGQEPVLARPQSTAYRLHKALRRHRAAFAAAAAIVIAVVAGSTVSVWQALRATRAEGVSEQRRRNEEVLRHNAERERERALESRERAELNEYVADISLAHQSILAGNLARATELLAKHRAKGLDHFEWRYLWHTAEGDENRLYAQEASSVLSLANSPEYLVVGLQDSVRIYEPKTARLVKTLSKSGSSVALSTVGLLATASKAAVRVWRTSDWGEAYSLPQHTAPMAFPPPGQRPEATSPKGVQSANSPDQKPVPEVPKDLPPLAFSAPVAFSPDGRRLATTSSEGVHLYNSVDGKLVAEIPDSRPPFAFSPNSSVLAVDTSKGIVLWDIDTAKTLRVLEHSEELFGPWVRGMNILVFSPDGHSIVAARNTLRNGSIFVLEVWASETGQKVASLPPLHSASEHSGMISSVASAPSGQLLASGSWDHSIRLWDIGTLQCIERLHGNPSEVWAVAFTPDGQGIISGAKDGTVRLWPTNTVAKERLYEGSWTPLKFSRDGRMLAAIDEQSRFALLNLRTGEPEDQLQLSKSQRGPWAGAISDDLRVLVTPLTEGGLRVWDLQSRKSVDLESPKTHNSWTVLSSDGKTLLTAERDSMLWWNLVDPSEAPQPIEGKGALFSRNGLVLVTLHERSIKIWDPKTRALKGEFPVEAELSFATPMALSDDGNILAVGSNIFTETENAIRLWDTRTGKLLGVCKGHTEGVMRLAFSPDGDTLASASSDSTLRIWNVRTQQELLSIQRLADPIRDILFSPEGNWLVGKTARGLRLLDGSREGDAAKATASSRGSDGQ